ncbi:MAG: tRNA 2-thiouridine(34) synthase MnmA [Bacteroidales bacterium]|nr:tRNA 2-thiouridine(34) synthase MnmA [Bacteroidales bacterium]
MKICVGLSGGVDSSVAALLLKRRGFDVFAMYMQNWHDIEGTLHGECEWEEEKFIAEMVARKIGIPFYFVDLSKDYMARVADYMFDEYSRGRTPNPDVLCNSQIKFDAFLNSARRLGADMVATGHYCRRFPILEGGGNPPSMIRDGMGDDADFILDGGANPEWRLLEGSDTDKCQAYFLCQLNQEQLSRALFPIGSLNKKEVRRLAAEADLPSADKKDSQGICFVGKVDMPVFLQQKLKSVEGDIVEVYPEFYSHLPAPESLDEMALPFDYSPIVFETETYRSGKKHIKKTRYKANPLGAIIGRHEGAQFYTIGQRRGLNVGGHKEPLFVISTDIARNIVYVGEGQQHPGLYRRALKINRDEVHFLRCPLQSGERRRCRVRIRYRQPLQDAELIMREGDLCILFDVPQRGVTPGQFAVWYSCDGGETPELLGSGPIKE